MPRTPAHFKVRVSIANHQKMASVYDDDALLAMWTRAGIECVKRFADRTSDSCLLSKRDLMSVAATTPWVNAQRKLRRLVAASTLRLRCGCATGPLRGRCECAAITLTFPNFARKHGFAGANGSLSGAYADADADADARRPKRGEPEAPAVRKQEPEYPHSSGVSNKAPPIVAQDQGTNRPKKRGVRNPTEVVDETSPPKPRLPSFDKPSEQAQAVFDQLIYAIGERLPGHSVPDVDTDRWRRWCHHLDLLHQIGEPGGQEGFSWEDIAAVVRWLPTHERPDFAWGLVIRSASNLRKHFSRLMAEMKQKGRGTTQGGWHAAGQAIHRQIEGGDHG